MEKKHTQAMAGFSKYSFFYRRVTDHVVPGCFGCSGGVLRHLSCCMQSTKRRLIGGNVVIVLKPSKLRFGERSGRWATSYYGGSTWPPPRSTAPLKMILLIPIITFHVSTTTNRAAVG
ncbi:hypothetical protein BHE74_00004239 [Ensete ventricosum]|nr:hypothetical protein BHE74_00004239 [Ensete ventricosum]